MEGADHKDEEAYVWVAYSKKPPYLPVAVADTAAELGRMIGMSKNSIISSWSHFQHGNRKKCRVYRVKVENERGGEFLKIKISPWEVEYANQYTG